MVSWREKPLNRRGRRSVTISLYSFLFVVAAILTPAVGDRDSKMAGLSYIAGNPTIKEK